MKVVKFVGYALGALAAFVLLAAAIVYVTSNAKVHQTFNVAVRPIAIPTDRASIARGDHIAHTRGCIDCHGADFAGHTVIDNGAMGLLSGPNITGGKGSATATFTDIDYVRAIRHGVSPHHRGYVLMPSEEFSHLSDEDLGALIAYLKSVPKVDRANIPIRLGPVSRVLFTLGKMKLAAATIDHDHLNTAAVPKGVTVAYGRYLSAGCVGCHNPNLSGGKIDVGPPDWPAARNLTPAGELAHWTEGDFVRAIREGKRPDGSALSPVMPRGFAGLDDTELGALYAYIKSLPAVPTGVRKPPTT